MDVIVLGSLCLGLCVYILHLQRQLREAYSAVSAMAEGILLVADGKVELERTAEGIKILMKKGGGK